MEAIKILRVATCNTRCQFGAVVALAMSSLLLGCAPSLERQISKAERQAQRAITALEKLEGADSLAAAALLNWEHHRSDALALIGRATATAPERPDLAWVHAQICSQVADCDPEPLERRVRQLDPSNGGGWMGALTRASSSKDDEVTDSALAAIGDSDRVDIYWTTLVARLARAAAQTKTISLDESEVLIVGTLAAGAIPAYSAASNACKGERLQRAEIIKACRGVARALMRGDTYITEMMGVAIAKRVWPEDSPEWNAAVEARRIYEYRTKLWAELSTPHVNEASSYLTLCAQHRREQDVFLTQLIAAGKDPNPPLE